MLMSESRDRTEIGLNSASRVKLDCCTADESAIVFRRKDTVADHGINQCLAEVLKLHLRLFMFRMRLSDLFARYIIKRVSQQVTLSEWTCHILVPLRLLNYAAFASKAKGLFQPRAECRLRGL